MPIAEFAPPITPPASLVDTLRERGFAVVEARSLPQLTDAPLQALSTLATDWDGMEVDPYLKDGGQYRRRRHASFVVDAQGCRRVPHRPHFQSSDYNALHGGMERWFEPMREALTQQRVWSSLLIGLANLCARLAPSAAWFVEAHQFRIDASQGIGRPTPEGAHRDGVDFVALLMVDRDRVRGGETRVFDAASPHGLRFTLSEPWTLLLLDDARVVHETTPIQPLLEDGQTGAHGHRDTLVLTFRRAGFQAPSA